MTRLPSGGRIDRSRPLRFRFGGVDYTGYDGDTVASALLANGVRTVANSVTLGRPRGIVSAGSEEPSALIQVDEPFAEPMQLATTLELYDGFAGSSIAGQGRLAAEPDAARYDAINAHCDVLVVGGGAAGVQAALDAARGGARVILADEGREFGGWTLAVGADLSSTAAALDELRALPEVQLLSRTTVFAYHDDNFLLAVERRTNHLGAAAPSGATRERLWRIRARDVMLATGAHERLIAFAGNDLPGVMLAGAVRAYLSRYAVRPGRRAVVFTNNDSTAAVVADLEAVGVEIVAVVDVRGESAREVIAASGDGQVEWVDVAPVGGGSVTRFAANLLVVSGGWNPAVHLFSQGGGTTRWDDRLSAFVPAVAKQRVTVIGAANGDGLDAAAPFWASGGADPATSFVDLQRDVTIADLRRATGAGLRSVEHIKRYTTAGTAHDQGKTSGVLTSALAAASLDREIADLGTTTYRGPYTPVAFATLAGRNKLDRLDPIRVTSLHDVHVGLGAAFENVGQWKRPWFYARVGEDMPTAVLRECAAARTDVGFMDASTLGKIDVQGPDAPEFLDRIYTNLMSTLKVGSVRYGAMCHADGMIFDDGTVMRTADDRYVTTTTTGNAAAVLDWMEEWLQTEWPQLRVYCTSVTEQWATIAVVGPRSRDVVGSLAADLAIDNESFPFMTWRSAVVAGLPARVARISFSGELAYELNVAWSQGPALWAAVTAAGQPYGITPYGTETMHVLRAEKGYPIIGQDTDGTVTPQDLGMEWVVSKKKPDFIGKRSFARLENVRVDRKQLVGLLPVDHDELLREGTQLIESATIGAPPVTMLGHVTSSYRSAYLGRTFALALVRSGRSRIGSQLYAVVGSRTVPVEVTSPVLVDPEGRVVTADRVVLDDPRLLIVELASRTMLNLRVAGSSADLWADVLGATLPTTPNTLAVSRDGWLGWLGPDEWLLVSGGEPASLEAELRAAAAVADEPVSVVDVSSARVTLRISGSGARQLLAHGCALDLHPSVFAVRRCVQTRLALANVIIATPADGPSYDVLVRTSFARYLADWLLDAATAVTSEPAVF